MIGQNLGKEEQKKIVKYIEGYLKEKGIEKIELKKNRQTQALVKNFCLEMECRYTKNGVYYFSKPSIF